MERPLMSSTKRERMVEGSGMAGRLVVSFMRKIYLCSWLGIAVRKDGVAPKIRVIPAKQSASRDPQTQMRQTSEDGAANSQTANIGGYGSRRSPGRRERNS